MADKGLAPLSPHGPAQPIEHVTEPGALDDRGREVVNEGLDYISKAQAGGESSHTLMRLRGLLRRLERKLSQQAARAKAEEPMPVDFDPTTGHANL